MQKGLAAGAGWANAWARIAEVWVAVKRVPAGACYALLKAQLLERPSSLSRAVPLPPQEVQPMQFNIPLTLQLCRLSPTGSAWRCRPAPAHRA